VTRQDLLRGRRPALSLAVVAPDHVDAVLVPDHPGPHAELADRMLKVLDQLGGIQSVFGVWRRGRGGLLIEPLTPAT